MESFFASDGFKYFVLILLSIINIIYFPWTVKGFCKFMAHGRKREAEAKSAQKMIELKNENQVVTFSKDEVARMLYISDNAVSELFARDDFPAQYIEGEAFVEADALKEYLRKRNIAQ